MKKPHLFGIGISLLAASIAWSIFVPVAPASSTQVLFAVEKGQGSREIGYNLEKAGLVRFSPLFRLYVLTTGSSLELQAGTYLLSPSLTVPQIVRKLKKGDTLKERITIIEGWDVDDIASRLEKQEKYSRQDVLAAASPWEGYLFPDTYEVAGGESIEDFVLRMRQNFERKLNIELRRGILKQDKTLEEIVIMASILERELQLKEDKEVAAGILWKRLAIGMPLQVDAAPQTYEERGFPKKPICNPGLASIEAAVYPKESPYLYYLSTPEGQTIFSKTLEEHNIAKAKYLK